MKVFIPHNHRRCQVCSQGFFADSPICFEAVGERETLVNHKALANHEASIKYETLIKYEAFAKIVPTDKVEGYDGIMQGGIVTTLHDSAMLHCLFQNSINAMTVSLTSRFHHPIAIGQELEIRAQWVKSRRNIHFLESKITQNGKLCSSAQSQFMS
ncbi:PaaI family thioesterase [Vibrio crassostreae]|uniref:PaaI family thioesterase n=1 Tax=Vibrio crassostreae TaxID=246167 RepID=UPI000631A2DA|nr:PaaI family thioesterase [Vibrio crassostreae]ROO75874.1 acyl-coenzyme A thioesterase PaaI-like protein [Vibrio crassostreae]ROP13881.1 acyl-coenzyme A thioesterase PaaI-like protein [Vibrio crassostreae]ROQ87969.1 acyl-coenzyme A thioesterase PaaI-like protein [Vibrio crassostreae]RPE94881.1 acyl-coenzyme A thioesterase PaaI-like protein [Vibrio crassostreae]RPF06343.1 acyl-coenzyme A thioesterase PaaI-like protein [Vibrio crassostreae]